MIDRILRPRKKWHGCIVTLPGRGLTGRRMCEYYRELSNLYHSLFIGVSPKNLEWYPLPNGPGDQSTSIKGLKESTQKFQQKVCQKLNKAFGTRTENTVLVGFSAGAVIALQTAIETDRNFAAIIAHCGAVLEPDKIPECPFYKKTMPILLTHSKNDTCFYWEERYLPTRNTLKEKGWNVACIEHEKGDHQIFKEDIRSAALFVAPLLNYPPTWKICS